jgi:hypothetical protein
VRRREADLVIRVTRRGDENLVGCKIGRLEVGFYATRDYAVERAAEASRRRGGRHVIAFADDRANA